MDKQKEETIKYYTKECEHKRLEKIAPMWYYCIDCGRIFNFVLSLQFSLSEALEYHQKIINGLTNQQKEIIKAANKETKKEKEAERQAIDLFKKSKKNGKAN